MTKTEGPYVPSEEEIQKAENYLNEDYGNLGAMSEARERLLKGREKLKTAEGIEAEIYNYELLGEDGGSFFIGKINGIDCLVQWGGFGHCFGFIDGNPIDSDSALELWQTINSYGAEENMGRKIKEGPLFVQVILKEAQLFDLKEYLEKLKSAQKTIPKIGDDRRMKKIDSTTKSIEEKEKELAELKRKIKEEKK